MPATPQPISGPLGVVWTPIIQAAHANKQKAANLAGQAQQGNLWDQFFNCMEVAGSNLSQTVTIGASHGVGGVQVGTGFASGTAGRAAAQNLANGTITLTAGSTSAPLVSITSGVFATGMVIGASDASGNAAITPGTTITGISGSTITLSQHAAESGIALYCAACNFVQAEPGGWQSLALTLPTGVTVATGYYTPAGRLQAGDTVTLRGGFTNSSATTYTNMLIGTVPAGMIPAKTVQPGNWSVDTSGGLRAGSLPASTTLGIDGVSYALL